MKRFLLLPIFIFSINGCAAPLSFEVTPEISRIKASMDKKEAFHVFREIIKRKSGLGPNCKGLSFEDIDETGFTVKGCKIVRGKKIKEENEGFGWKKITYKKRKAFFTERYIFNKMVAVYIEKQSVYLRKPDDFNSKHSIIIFKKFDPEERNKFLSALDILCPNLKR